MGLVSDHAGSDPVVQSVAAYSDH
ncbi:MAG: hypothetical protein QOJ71_2022, partial [Actinomycetota bacterium]|nr:hypothetical protein [Actinomycetota bacterium]